MSAPSDIGHPSSPEAMPLPAGVTVHRTGPNAITIASAWRYAPFNTIVFLVWLGFMVMCLFLDEPANRGVAVALMLAFGYVWRRRH